MLLIPVDRWLQSPGEIVSRLVVKDRVRLGKRWNTNLNVREGMFTEFDRYITARHPHDLLRELEHSDRVCRISDVEILSDRFWPCDHLDDGIAKVGDVAPGPNL